MQNQELDEYGRPYPQYTKRRVPFLTVDALVIKKNSETNNYELLLITRGIPPYVGHHALPGGHIEYNENPEDAVLRELMEETNIKGESIELLTVHGDPKRDPRRHTITIAYIVQVASDCMPKAGDDAATAKFIPIEEVIKLKDKFAFDHWEIIKKLLKKLNIPY